jgi:hypothetical protein
MCSPIVEEDHGADGCSVRFSAESPARLCAWVPPSLCRVYGLGCVLGLCRVSAESPEPSAAEISLHDQGVRGNRR